MHPGRLALILLFITSSNLARGDDTTIDDFNFLAGYWEGAGFGGQSEEMWMPAKDGRMFGIFKQSFDGELSFTEFMEIIESEDGWELRLKHFNPDFTGWEESTEHVSFPFVSVSENKAVFNGLSYEITAAGKLRIELRLRRGDGSISTEVFEFSRVPLP